MIGDTIIKIRTSSGLTTEQFCKELNISAAGLNNIESGVSAPGTEVLFALANKFDIPVRTLAREEFPKSDEEIREEKSIIGNNLKRYRKAAGRTQEEIAELLGLPSAERVEFIEQGRVGLSKEQIIKCCDVFDVDIPELMFADMPEEPDGIFIDYKSEHCDLIKDFMMLCNSKEKPEFFSSIENLINLSVTKLKELEKISETHT